MESRKLLVFALLAAGCANVLGIEEPEPRPDDPAAGGTAGANGQTGGGGAGGSTTGMAGAAGKPGTGGMAGAAGMAGTPSGEAGQAGDGGQGGAGPTCEVDTKRCGGAASKTPEICNEDGEWVTNSEENGGQDCPAFCAEGICTECMATEMKCNGNIRQACVNGFWTDQVLCESYCLAGVCQNPPSCSGLENCTGGVSCCRALEVPGGTFARDYDGNNFADDSYSATISGFLLDKFEVTVGRMRRFVNAYSAIMLEEGDGKAPHILDDEGWHEDYPMPATVDELRTVLTCADTTWTDEVVNEMLPINCVPFHVAYAFCVWDGGRLPTEAEWNYVAAGGDQQREYPWVVPLTEDPPTEEHAYFGQVSGLPIAVGSKPLGNGRWEHSDLAGNVLEWTLDFYADYPETCNDCLNAVETEARPARGGPYLSVDPEHMLVALRWETPTDWLSSDYGFRCAYDLE